jgi:hypothetical protein
VVKSCWKDGPTASVLLEAKAAALHPKRYQTSLSKSSTKERENVCERDKKRNIGDQIDLTSQINGKATYRQVEDKQMDTSKQGR